MLLEGKTAIVTGASGGIGKAVAIALAKEGAAVAVHFHGNEEKALLVKKEIVEAGGKAEIFRANVADFEECNALVKAVAKTFGSIDILVNNAGVSDSMMTIDCNPEHFQEIINLNVNAVFNAIQPSVELMKEQGGGCIINTSSMVSKYGQPGGVAYPTSKFGVNGLTISLAR